MREIRFTKTFFRNWRALHRARLVGYDDLDTVVYLLEKGESLPLDFDDHALTDNYEGYREFHLSGDVIVIYKASLRRVTLMDVGGHAAMFGHRKHKRKGVPHPPKSSEPDQP